MVNVTILHQVEGLQLVQAVCRSDWGIGCVGLARVRICWYNSSLLPPDRAYASVKVQKRVGRGLLDLKMSSVNNAKKRQTSGHSGGGQSRCSLVCSVHSNGRVAGDVHRGVTGAAHFGDRVD